MEWIPDTHGPNPSGKDVEEARERILAITERVNHEFRTPLSQVFGLIDLLLGTALEPDQRSLAQELQAAAQSLLDRLTDVLTLTDLEEGLLDTKSQEFRIDDLLERVGEAASLATLGRENQVEIEPNPDLPDVVYGDPWRLQRALVHTVGHVSGCVDGATIQLASDVDRSSPDEVEVAFELRIAQIPPGPNVVEEGEGPGLAFARALMSALGGTLEGPTFSRLGAVARLRVCFPEVRKSEEVEGKCEGRHRAATLDRPAAVQTPTPGPGGSEPPLPRVEHPRKVLLAEDNRVTQAVTRRLLERRGHDVDVAGNGKEAVEKVRSCRYDVVLMDLDMPVLDGISATREIRSLSPSEPPIVAYTAHVLSENRRRCIDAGVDGFLAKPVSSGELFQEVERWPPRTDA
jgi:CheY-like chemotaxis protein